SYRRLGNPRLQVTRVIDLTGLSIREVRLGGVHLLAYRYGDWFDIRGASQTVNVLLDRDDDHRAHIREFVHDRLYPNPLIRAEIDVIARGVRGAARTRDWIAKSQSWSVGELPVAVQPWADRVRDLAEQVLTASARRPNQISAARALVAALYGDSVLVRDLVEKDFATLTESAPHRREELIAALFATAQQSRTDAAIADLVETFAAAGFALIVPGPHG